MTGMTQKSQSHSHFCLRISCFAQVSKMKNVPEFQFHTCDPTLLHCIYMYIDPTPPHLQSARRYLPLFPPSPFLLPSPAQLMNIKCGVPAMRTAEGRSH